MAIRKLFEGAEKHLEKCPNSAKCVIFIDEIDSLGSRKSYGFSDARYATIGQLLTCMDGLKSYEDIIVIAATNHIEGVDGSLLRSGRFDKIIAMDLPSAETREKIVRKHTKNRLPDDLVNTIVEASTGFNCADIKNFCDEVRRILISRAIMMKNENEELDVSEITVGGSDVKSAFKRVYEKISSEPIREGLKSDDEIDLIFSKHGC